MSGKEAIFWDSCIFIAYIKNENREDENDMAGINELVQLIDMKQYLLTTSVITITEVLSYKTGAEPHQKFLDIFKRPNSLLIDITRPIAEIAHNIRNDHIQPDGSTLSTPDCLQLAAAINYKCSTFYTFDGCSGKKTGILDLNEEIKNKYGIEILRPSPKYHSQPNLPML